MLPRRGSAPAPVAAARRRPSGDALGFAVVGCGDIGAENAAAIAGAANARVVTCFDTAHALAAAAAERYGAVASENLEAALSHPGIEAVVVSVPHAAHEDVSVAALERGLHVVVEKPVGHDLPSARRIADAAQQSRGLASICLPFRYEPSALAAQSLIAGDGLGEFRGSAISMLVDKPPSYWLGGYSGRAASSWRSSRAAAGGGILIMNATHLIDRVLHLTGATVEEVSAFAARSPECGEVEDSIAVTLRYAGGAVGSIVGASTARGSNTSELTLWGGTRSDRSRRPAASVHAARHGRGGGAVARAPVRRRRRSAHCVLRTVRGAVRGARPLEIPLSDGVRVQEVVEAAYRSAERDAPVRIEELR